MHSNKPTEEQPCKREQKVEAKLAIWQGMTAKRKGLKLDDNPYNVNTLLWHRWIVGWISEDSAYATIQRKNN